MHARSFYGNYNLKKRTSIRGEREGSYLLVLTASHENILLILIGMELGCEERLSFPKCLECLASLCVPELDVLIISCTQELPTIIAELDISDTLHHTNFG